MKRTLLTALAVVVVALLVAACGDSSGDTTNDGGAVATTAAPSTTMHSDDGDEHSDDDHGDDDHAAGVKLLDDSATPDSEIDVTAIEFEFEPASITVAKGEVVRFNVTNEGSIQHEFRITNQQAAEAHLSGDHSDHDDMMAGEAMVMEGDLVVLLDPGQSVSVTVEFTEDAEYNLVACLLPGHFEAGMKADLTLES